MVTKRNVEIFSAGCPVCNDAVEMVERISCRNCAVTVLDMNDPAVAKRAKALGLRSVPAVVIDGNLVDGCKGKGPDEAALEAAGIGLPLP